MLACYNTELEKKEVIQYSFFQQKYVSTSFLTHEHEQTIALNSDVGESSGCVGDTAVQIVERDSVKQLSTTMLDSINPCKTQQQSWFRAWHVKKLKINAY